MNLNMGAFDPSSRAMGPGLRAVVWVRGCSINCSGCTTQEFISSAPTQLTSLDSLWERIDRARLEHGLEGVSFSGGEPFEQAVALAALADRARRVGLSTLSWSGYTRAFLQSPRSPQGSHELLEQLDVLIDGPFVASRAQHTGPLRGSSNQVVHLLTRRYQMADLEGGHAKLEVDADGQAVISGVINYERLDAVLSLFGVSR